MALTISNVNAIADDIWGRHKVRIVDVTFDSSYPTGGESFTAANVGLAELHMVLSIPKAATTNHVVQYDYTNSKLKVLGVEQDADGATVEPLDEETNTADLSTLVVRVLCIGI